MSEQLPPPGDYPSGLLKLAEEKQTPSVLLAGLLVLAILYTLYFARPVMLPVVLAILLALILMPAVRALHWLHIPRALGAAVVVMALVGILFGLISWIYDPATQWIEKAPYTLSELERKMRGIRKSVDEVAKVAEKVEQLATTATTAPAPAAKPQPGPAPGTPSLLQRTFTTTITFLVTTLMILVLLYFLLAMGDMLLQKAVEAMPTFGDKKRVVEITRKVESRVATYLGTVTMINAGLGVATGFAMYWLGMPNPVLWGVMVFFLNFFPYIGAATSLAILTVVAMLTFDELNEVLLVPGVFFTLTVIEGQILAPMIIGRNLILNPVAVLLSMLFWGWLWGVAGALLAVPILVAFQSFCEHTDSLQALGEFLAGRSTEPRAVQLAPKAAPSP